LKLDWWNTKCMKEVREPNFKRKNQIVFHFRQQWSDLAQKKYSSKIKIIIDYKTP
jgi:hypothetical protein